MTISSFVTFWLCSIAFSGVGALVCTFAVLKEAADSGYRFVFDSDLLEKLRTREGEMKRRMQLFVPLYNILSQFYNLITIKSNSGLLITELYTLGLLEEMTQEEKMEYSKNPGGINAMMISIESKIKEEEKKSLMDEPKTDQSSNINNLEMKFNKEFRDELNNLELNADNCLKINGFEVHFSIVEEEGRKKIVFADYKGNLAKMSDNELKFILPLCVLDAKSTVNYLEKLLSERKELKATSSEEEPSVKQKYTNLREEVLRIKEAMENNEEKENNLTKK